MSSISNCPTCKQAVTVPEGAGGDTKVRCPFCNSQAPLSDILDQDPPPSLIPVEPSGEKDTEQSPTMALPPSLDTDKAPAEDEPATPTVTAKAIAEEEPDSVSVALPPTLEASDASASEPAIDSVGESTTVEEAIPFKAAAEDKQPADESAATDFTDTGAASTEKESFSTDAVSAGVASAKPRPKRKQKGAGRQMIEAIVGGFGGLLIAYYLVMWFGGDLFNLPRLPLPFLPPAAEVTDAAGDTKQATPPDTTEEHRRPTPPRQPPKREPVVAEKKPEPETEEIKPLTDEEPVSMGDSLPADYVGPRNSPRLSSLDLGQALRAADQALKGPQANGNVTQKAYSLLCEAARADAFANNEAGDPQHVHRKLAAGNMLRNLGRDATKLSQIWDLAAAELKAEGGPQGGIVFAGTVGTVSSKDKLHAAVIKPTGYSAPLVVLSDKPLPMKNGDEIIMFGSIVKEPSKNIVGYSGTMPMVIWAGSSAKVK